MLQTKWPELRSFSETPTYLKSREEIMIFISLLDKRHKSTLREKQNLNSVFPNRFHWIDDEATVAKNIEVGKRGRVNYHGISWLAQSSNDMPLLKDTSVRVIGRKNLTLIVEESLKAKNSQRNLILKN